MTISSRHKSEKHTDPYINLKKESEKISAYIKNALLGEVFTTPKPGLVDLWDNGAHRDMNWITFRKSADAITPYLTAMYEEGYAFRERNWSGEKLDTLFLEIRETGRQAERAMYNATGGVNTHKGMLFSMGIICAALGYCRKKHFQNLKADGQQKELSMVWEVLDIARYMTEDILQKELQDMEAQVPKTHGERMLARYGERGIRGEVLDGFPVVRKTAYPELMKLMKEADKTVCQSQVNLQVLLKIMSELRDTNVLNRGGEEGLLWIQKESGAILKMNGAFSEEGMKRLIQMNQECIRKNISSGGAADQLALTLFLWQAINEKEIPVYCPVCIE